MTRRAPRPPRRPLPPGWMLDAEGRHAPEPVEVPLGEDPFQIRAWVRCTGPGCRARVEVLVYCGDLPDTEAARRERLAAVRADLGVDPRCAACQGAPSTPAPPAAPTTVFLVNRPQAPAPKALPPPPLPVEIRNLVRSGRPPSASDPRGGTMWWTRAQDQLRALHARAPGDFAAMLPELLGELRQIQGWHPYWTDFLRTYFNLTRSTP